MTESRDSFVFYKSFHKAIKQIPRKHRLVVYDAIFDYIFESQEPSLSGVSGALWDLIKPQLDANNVRYENGKKGAPFGKKRRKTEENRG